MNHSTGIDGTSPVSRFFHRRTLLKGGAAVGGSLLAAGVAGCSGGGSKATRDKRGTAVQPASASSSTVCMQLVAHPDDDLYFMNPDVRQTIRAGGRSVTVFLTCGEDDGRNGDRVTGGKPSFEHYSASRQNGSRAAYAFMATGRREAAWKRERKDLGGIAVAELDRLEEAPNVTLIWLNIRKTEGPKMKVQGRLRTLWNGDYQAMTTLVPTGSPVAGPYRYTRDDLVKVLVGLLDEYQPSVVRTLDIDPDFFKHGRTKETRQHADYGDHTDHQDHTAAALFSWAALEAWKGRSGGLHTVVDSYRGYYNERWPHNLAPSAVKAKKEVIDVYGWADGVDFCKDPVGCGDRKIRDLSLGGGWPQSTTLRYSGGAPWAVPLADGRLAAFAVLDGDAAVWTQRSPGSEEWGGPETLAGIGQARLAPSLGVARDAGGRPVVAGLAVAMAARADRQRRDVMVITRSSPDGGWRSWENLGNPDAGDPLRRRGVGVPVLCADGDGRIHLFVRNFAQGVSSRVRGADGKWGPWKDLGGAQIQEGLSAVTARDGHIEVFATHRKGVHRWVQNASGDVVFRELLPAGNPAGPPTAVRRPDGCLAVYYRKAESAAILTLSQTAEGGGWSAKPREAGPGPGIGALAVLAPPTSGAQGVIAHRDASGTVGFAPLPASGVPGEWRSGGGLFAHTPGAAFDSEGRVVLLVLGLDGELMTSRQKSPGKKTFGPWLKAGA